MQKRMAELPDQTHAQFIGFGAYANTVSGYLGTDDMEKDVMTRFNLMKRMMDEAHKVADRSPDTLKVFCAPEFYWRGGHSSGGVTEQLAAQIVQELSVAAADDKFESWLFVFGTIVVVADGREQNIAPVVAGGSAASQRFICTKKFISTINFNDGHAGNYDPLQAYLKGSFEASGWAIADDGFVLCGKVRICVEICLDHLEHIGKDLIIGQPWSAVPAIHIVTSCGMNLQPAKGEEDRILGHSRIEFLQDGHVWFGAPTVLKVDGEELRSHTVEVADGETSDFWMSYLGPTFKKDAADNKFSGSGKPLMLCPQLRVFKKVELGC